MHDGFGCRTLLADTLGEKLGGKGNFQAQDDL